METIDPINTVKAKTDGFFSSFGDSRMINAPKEFLMSNTMTAKFSFLIMVLIVFILLIRLSFAMMNLFFGVDESPVLVKGLRKANKYLKVKTTGKGGDIKPIVKSVNEDLGMEFTYSIWLNIDDTTSFTGSPRIIFTKNFNATSTPRGSPVLYLTKDSQSQSITLNANMESYGTSDGLLSVKDIPTGKWVHVAVRLEHHNFDILINGNIRQRKFIKDVPKQNTYDVLVTPGEKHGFNGLISNLHYYNRGLNSLELMDIVAKGPNLKADKTDMVFPPFLSMRWFGIGA